MLTYLISDATIGGWLTQLSEQPGAVQQHLVQVLLTECVFDDNAILILHAAIKDFRSADTKTVR